MDTRKLTARLAALALAAVVSFSAQAGAPGTHVLKVNYRDLDLTTSRGATELYGRIRGAARFVCGEEGRSIDEQNAWQSCFRSAVSEAVSTVHSPLVTALDTAGAPPARTAQLRN